MSNSKIQTRSYFIKRMRDSGYIVDRFGPEFSQNDNRKWTAIIDSNGLNIIVICYKDGSFLFYDGLAYTNNFIKINTDSIEVIITYLNNWGILDKHFLYGKKDKYENGQEV